MDNTILENAAQVVKNQGATPAKWPKVKILGSMEALTDAVNLSAQRAGIVNLVTSSCLLTYCLDGNHSSEEVKAFKEGVESFSTFLLECVTEYQKIQDEANAQQTGPETSVTA